MIEPTDFHYSLVLAKLLYDIDIIDEEDAIEIGLIAYNKIGNKRTILKRAVAPVDSETGVVKLPCDVDIIEAVTYVGSEDWNYTSNTKEYGDLASQYIENYIEGNKERLDPYYIEGSYVKFKKVGDRLYVNKGLGKVNILYHSIQSDENDLPILNEKEADAIAAYIAYTYRYKQMIKTKTDQMLPSIVQDLKQQWLMKCDQARVPEYLNQNDLDKVADANARHDRKQYGKSYKPMM